MQAVIFAETLKRETRFKQSILVICKGGTASYGGVTNSVQELDRITVAVGDGFVKLISQQKSAVVIQPRLSKELIQLGVSNGRSFRSIYALVRDLHMYYLPV